MTKEELIKVKGGISLSGTLLNAITKAVTVIYDIAKRFGTAIYRTKNGNYCIN